MPHTQHITTSIHFTCYLSTLSASLHPHIPLPHLHLHPSSPHGSPMFSCCRKDLAFKALHNLTPMYFSGLMLQNSSPSTSLVSYHSTLFIPLHNKILYLFHCVLLFPHSRMFLPSLSTCQTLLILQIPGQISSQCNLSGPTIFSLPPSPLHQTTNWHINTFIALCTMHTICSQFLSMSITWIDCELFEGSDNGLLIFVSFCHLAQGLG